MEPDLPWVKEPRQRPGPIPDLRSPHYAHSAVVVKLEAKASLYLRGTHGCCPPLTALSSFPLPKGLSSRARWRSLTVIAIEQALFRVTLRVALSIPEEKPASRVGRAVFPGVRDP